jgi:hypothetical protein
MTYSSGGLIQAADYNGFVSTNVGANLNATLNTAYGQTALATVSTNGIVTATNWASLVNSTASMGAHTNTTITARSAPSAGQTINVLAAVNTDLTNIYNNRYNAVSVGTQFTGWTGTNSYTAGRGSSGGAAWNMQFNNLVSWSSAAAAQYFFNAGGLIRVQTSKTSTGATGDPEWNDLANTLSGVIWISGLGTSHTIAGTAYNGVTKIGGSGAPAILNSTLGWDGLTAGTANQVVYQQYADTAPYTSNNITTYLTRAANSTSLNILTIWSAVDTNVPPTGGTDPVSGGTAPTGATPGTAPCTIVTYYPPETTNLSNTWGTPTVTSSIV